MSGFVYLVGAGPGDPGLLTVRAVELIAAADAILYDRLIPHEALDGARADAELIYVGKEGGGPSMDQAEIELLLIEHARAGERVVRLKGGDPFVFGRGGEEALALRAAGIPFEVVPGITAGVAAPAYAGIPVTHRELASAVAFVTGHEAEPSIDWAALAAFPGTLVFYMGVRALPRLAERLVEAGRDPGEPAAVVERGTLPGQRTVVATLGDVAERAAGAGVRAPAVTIVGPVAGLREQLAWLEARPLFGRTVAVTRARTQASALAARLRELGAAVVEAPAIRTRSLEAPLPALDGYDLVCVTSPVGAAELWARLRAAGLDARALAGRRVAAIGPGTARALEEHGIAADVVPERRRRGGVGRGAGRRPGVAGAGGAGARGARCAARCAPGARRRGGRPAAVRDGSRAARRRDGDRGARGRLSDIHLRIDRALLRSGGRRRRAARAAARLDRPRHQRSAARARRRAGRRGRAAHAGRARRRPRGRRSPRVVGAGNDRAASANCG